MSNLAKLGQGVQLQTGSPLAAIAQLTSIKGPGPKLDVKDATNLDSGDYKEFIAGLIDPGELQCEGQFVDNGGFSTMLSLLQSRATSAWEVTFPSAVTSKKWTFDGFVTALEPTHKSEDIITFTATLKITGAASLA